AALGTGVRALRRRTRRTGRSRIGVRVRSRVIAQTRIGSGVRTGLLRGLGGTAREVEGHGVALFAGVAVVAFADIGVSAGGAVRAGRLRGLGATARGVEGHGVGLFEGGAVVASADIGDGAGGTIRVDGRGIDFESLVLEVLRRRGLGESDVVVPIDLDGFRGL